MFTGIVEALGQVTAVERAESSARVQIRADLLDGVREGESVAVNGVCLTVVTPYPPGSGCGGARMAEASFDVMAATLDRTSLAGISPGAQVNLERAMKADGRFGGHIVQGHVDGTARVVDRVDSERWRVLTFELPPGLARYVVAQGSITLDGVSLTVSGLGETTFTVSLIPETLSRTVLGRKEIGDLVNIEVDVLAKYVERLLGARGEVAP